MSNDLPHSLERSVLICAERSTVFSFFMDSNLFARWWGPGSTIDPKPGGKVVIRYPNAVEAGGEVVEISDGRRISFTYGYETGKPIPLGSSLVTITLIDRPDGTELQLRHDLATAALRDAHVGGWRYQMALFANAACNEQHKAFVDRLQEYFRIWNTQDRNERIDGLKRLVAQDVRFRDAYGCVVGCEELDTHIGAVQQFMPGLNLALDGDAVQCQGTAMARWVATRQDGTEAAHGTNLFHFTPDGRIHSIVGFWMPA